MIAEKLFGLIERKALQLLLFTLTFSTVKAQVSNNSLHFNGSNFVVVGTNSAFSFQANTSTTFEGWIRFCNDGVIFSKNWCAGQAGYYMNVVNGGQIRVKGIDVTSCNQGDLFLLTTSQVYSFNTWHHFAFIIETTANTTNVKVYMNGVLVLSSIQNGLTNNSNQDLILGAYRGMGGSFALPFQGDIDEFRVYNAALTPAELGLSIPTNPSLVLHYEMEPQVNPLATSEPNAGSLGSAFDGNNVVLTLPSTSTILNYNLTSVYLPTVDLGADTTLNCGVNIIDLSTNNNATSYTWQESNPTGSSWQTISANNVNTLNYNLGNSTTASVVVTGTIGFCVDSDTINITTINPSSFSLGNDTTICDGASIILDVSSIPGTYLWQNGSTASSFTATNAGSYWVEVTNNGCSSSDTISISTANSPNFNLGNDTTLCFGQSLLLDAPTIPGTYLWQDGSVGSNFIVNQSGIYWLSITNICGTVTDSLTVNYYPDYSFSLGNDTTICIGNTLELICDIPNSNVVWQDGSTGPSYIALIAGEYYAQLTLNGCLLYDTIQINTVASPQVDLGDDIILCEGEDVLISIQNQTNSLVWSTGSTESSIVVSSGGVYSVEVNNICGTDTDSISVEMEECYCGFYVPNAFTPNDDEFNSGFGPVFDCIVSAYKLEIYNRWGEVIFKSGDPNYLWDGTYLGKIVQDGVYSYKITYSTQYVIAKTITGHVTLIR